MLDFLGHTALLVTSRNGALPDYTFHMEELVAEYSLISIFGERMMYFLVPVGYELVEEPVDEFPQHVVYLLAFV